MTEVTKEQILTAVKKQLKNKDFTDQASIILRQSTASVLERIKQNVNAQIQEDSNPIINEFVSNVSDKMGNITQRWTDSIDDSMIVFPEGTRFIHNEGEISVILVEQPPRTRIINFLKERYNLSLPYVQFIFAISERDGDLFLIDKVKVCCSKKSITNLDQAGFELPLPNVSSLEICQGSMEIHRSKDVTTLINNFIDAFWASAFNSDLTDTCIKFFIQNELGIDASGNIDLVRGFAQWHEKTKENALFIFGKDIKYKNAKNFRSLVRDAYAKRNVTSKDFVNKMKVEINKSVSDIGETLKDLFTKIDVDVENRAKVHEATLDDVLKEIVLTAYSDVWDFCQVYIKEESVKLRKEMEEKASKLRQEFDDYMKNKTRPEGKNTW